MFIKINVQAVLEKYRVEISPYMRDLWSEHIYLRKSVLSILSHWSTVLMMWRCLKIEFLPQSCPLQITHFRYIHSMVTDKQRRNYSPTKYIKQ